MMQNFKDWKAPELSEDKVNELFERASEKVKRRRVTRSRFKKAAAFAAVVFVAGGLYFQQKASNHETSELIAKIDGDVSVLTKMGHTYNDMERIEGGARENIN
jgi:hypothetical protein